MSSKAHLPLAAMLCVVVLFQPLACLTPPLPTTPEVQTAAESHAETGETMNDLDAWTAAKQMGVGINIGNTLENTTAWETGWGNPRITKAYVESLARLGFKTVRVPVAWDTYAVDERIPAEKLERVNEVVDWIIEADLFAVVNIHWDGGWIDSSAKERFPDTYATFSPEAKRKYRGYWRQISEFFAHKNEKLVFEALNEETNFENEGSVEQAFATLTRVQQLFIDTVRRTGGNNAKRLLLVAGYHTDIVKTCSEPYKLPTDTVAHRMLISVHYYTPWQFCGMTEDADWGKVMPTWGSAQDVAQLNQLFDKMAMFTKKHDLPAFIGEFGVVADKAHASRVRWLTAVFEAALKRNMVPVLWDTGGEMSRHPPYAPKPALREVLENVSKLASAE